MYHHPQFCEVLEFELLPTESRAPSSKKRSLFHSTPCPVEATSRAKARVCVAAMFTRISCWRKEKQKILVTSRVEMAGG